MIYGERALSRCCLWWTFTAVVGSTRSSAHNTRVATWAVRVRAVSIVLYAYRSACATLLHHLSRRSVRVSLRRGSLNVMKNTRN